MRHQNFEFTGTDILRGYELVLSERIMGNGVSRLSPTDAGVPPLPAFLAPKTMNPAREANTMKICPQLILNNIDPRNIEYDAFFTRIFKTNL